MSARAVILIMNTNLYFSKYLSKFLSHFLLFSISPSFSLQGRCVITVQLADEELAEDEDGVDYFLLFAGSTQRHLTSTLRSSHDTLQALCPGKLTHPKRLKLPVTVLYLHMCKTTKCIWPAVPRFYSDAGS